MAGALGDEVAEGLAQHLGYRLVRREDLIRLAGEFLGTDDALERSPELRERSPSFWERLNESRQRYSTVLRSVVIGLAEEGDVVIIGLGAGQFLRGLRHVIRVQIIASRELRAQRLVESGDPQVKGSFTPDQARDYLRQRDRDSAGYIRYLAGIDWLDSSYWDVVVNTGSFTVEESVELIAAAARVRNASADARDEQRLRNLALASRVEVELVTSQQVWVSNLHVVARQGEVRVEGSVVTDEDRDVAEQVALGVEGVRVVQNALRIQPPSFNVM